MKHKVSPLILSIIHGWFPAAVRNEEFLVVSLLSNFPHLHPHGGQHVTITQCVSANQAPSSSETPSLAPNLTCSLLGSG